MIEKPLKFIGSAYSDLIAMPFSARHDAGFQLGKVQNQQEPDDWKPMPSIGAGVQEIRIRDEAGQFRVIYVAKFADGVYVLHCFQKKTQKTSKPDIELARRRYAELIRSKA